MRMYLLLGCFICSVTSIAKPPYALPPGTKGAVIFNPGNISTSDDEFGGTFTPDGTTIFFSKSVLSFYLETILYSEFKNGQWSKPAFAPFSGAYRSFDPVISPDGTKILFASDRPVDGKRNDGFDIWMVEKTTSGWSEAKRLPAPINTEHSEHFASMSANGNIYFSSDRPGAMGGPGDADIYRSRLVNGVYQPAEHLDSISSVSYELDCTVAPDESFLMVGSYFRQGGPGSYDIFISFRKDEGWTMGKSVGPPVNTAFRDYSPRISPDGNYLFFTSERDVTANAQRESITYPDLVKQLRGLYNGSGNIYQVALAELGIRSPVVKVSRKK